MKNSVVVMGVTGCGKSSLATALAAATGAKLLEGDDYHPPLNREKMRQGIPLTDSDRDGWLTTLGELLRKTSHPAVLTCSALKKAYRDKLRSAVPDLYFIFLEIRPRESAQRVAARGAEHFMPVSLVESQFATLEPPVSEPGVLTLDAQLPLEQLSRQASLWLKNEEAL